VGRERERARRRGFWVQGSVRGVGVGDEGAVVVMVEREVVGAAGVGDEEVVERVVGCGVEVGVVKVSSSVVVMVAHMMGARLMRRMGWRVELFQVLEGSGLWGGSGVWIVGWGMRVLVRDVLDRWRRTSRFWTRWDALCMPRSNNGPLNLKLRGI
jgi:hypothetical protein